MTKDRRQRSEDGLRTTGIRSWPPIGHGRGGPAYVRQLPDLGVAGEKSEVRKQMPTDMTDHSNQKSEIRN